MVEGPQEVAQDVSSGIVASDGASNSTGLQGSGLRDAGAGKVRGPQGRYVNKCTPSPATKGSRAKSMRKCKYFELRL